MKYARSLLRLLSLLVALAAILIAAVTARAVELIIGARACRAALDTPVVVAPSLTVRESTAPPRS